MPALISGPIDRDWPRGGFGEGQCFLRAFARLAAGGSRQGLMQGRSAGTPTALRCSARGRVAELTLLTAFGFVQTGVDESVYKARKRADPNPPLLVAPEIAPAGHRPPRAEPLVCISRRREERFDLTQGFALAEQATTVAAKVRSGRWQCASSALTSGRLLARARSALRKLTCRRMFERSEQSERSEFGDRPGD